MKTGETNEGVRKLVREGYTRVARADCCGLDSADGLARAVGYSDGELESLPEGANMGLSCGNPTALASLRPDETVLDLGSGGGFDVFLAGRRVGAGGRVIGVDMTPEMISKARANVAAYRASSGLDNVEFRLGEIEHLPVADGSADVVISNCVINLSPDKPAVWREIARVLQPGGRVAVSDLALLRPLPEEIRGMLEALVGCVAGAVLLEEYEAMIEASGLTGVKLEAKRDYVDKMTEWNDPLYRKIVEHLPEGATAASFITSVYATAGRPQGS